MYAGFIVAVEKLNQNTTVKEYTDQRIAILKESPYTNIESHDVNDLVPREANIFFSRFQILASHSFHYCQGVLSILLVY